MTKAKENTGARSKYGKTLIKSLARSWAENLGNIPALLRYLHEDFLAGGFEKKKVDTFYRETVEGVLARLQLSSEDISRYLELSESVIDPEKNPFSWIDEDDAEDFFEKSPVVESELYKELAEYVKKVESVWSYMKPFYFRRSKKNPSALLVCTSVGFHTKANIKTSVNAAIGSRKLPEIGREHLVYEDGIPVKYGLDGEDGRIYWGWAFKIVSGTNLRLWLSRVIGYDSGEKEVWEQRAKVIISLQPELPKGYRVLSARHEDYSADSLSISP